MNHIYYITPSQKPATTTSEYKRTQAESGMYGCRVHDAHAEPGKQYGGDVRQPAEDVRQNRVGTCP